jgi:hypothetical protein
MQASHAEPRRHLHHTPTPGPADREESPYDDGMQGIDDLGRGGSAGPAGLGLAYTKFHPIIDG